MKKLIYRNQIQNIYLFVGVDALWFFHMFTCDLLKGAGGNIKTHPLCIITASRTQAAWQLVKVTIALGDSTTCHLDAVTVAQQPLLDVERLVVRLGCDITLQFVTLEITFSYKTEVM